MRLLDELQDMLHRTYDLDSEHRVTDFLTADTRLIEALGVAPESAGAREQVLVSQAEVDKFVLTALLLATAQGRASDPLHHGLFRRSRIDPYLCPEARARYHAASRFAESYCRRLLERFRRRRDFTAVAPELRRFYRMSQRAKLSRIGLAA